MDRDDAALVSACRAGDQEAWEILVRRYQRLIYSVPLRAGLSHDDAGEVFQRVWLILLEKLDTLTQPERLSAWLVTTARRESWSRKRAEARSLPLTGPDPDDEGAHSVPDPDLLPDEVLERMERQHVVREALATLDSRCRTLLSTLFLHQDPPSYAEVAAALGTSVGSIGPTRARCLEKLRASVERLGL